MRRVRRWMGARRVAINRRLKWLLAQPSAPRHEALRKLTGAERREFRHHWRLWARDEQVPPSGDWAVWLVMAGRGFGKTRLGAEWVREMALDPAARIALVGASYAEVRAVMVEGESGVIALGPPERRPRFEPSLRRLIWANGAQAALYSAGEPEGLRGAQHSHAWSDEIAKWDNAGGRAEAAWNNLLFGMRLGEHPRVVATTTPRSVALIERLVAGGEDAGAVVVTRGRTEDNAENLPQRFLSGIRREFGKSLLARQELDGELIADREGALWTRGLIERGARSRRLRARRCAPSSGSIRR